MRNSLLLAITLVSSIIPPSLSSAAADVYLVKNPPSAGAKGTITAWDLAREHVIQHRFCAKTKLAWDYVGCGNAFREDLKLHMCVELGAGSHKYLYQVGDGKAMESSVYCPKK